MGGFCYHARVSSDVNDRDDDERTDPHIVAPKAQPTPAAAPRTSSIPQRPFPAASVTTGTMPKVAPRLSDPALRATDPSRPPVLPLRPAATTIGARPSAPPAAPERPSDIPPTSSLTAAMLIPRPSSAPPAGRPSDPGGSDPLRERLAQVEIQSAASRSIAMRIEGEAVRANTRLDALDPRLTTLESSLRERIAQLETQLESATQSLQKALEAPRAAPTEDTSELGTLKTAIATLRQSVGEHDRQFEARRARVESLETRVTAVEGDPRLVEVRRATESFDLRIVAVERAQEALRADVDARLRAIESRLAEAPAKKAAAPEPEIRRIKGVGPKYEKALRELGITTIAQVAAMGDDDLARVASTLAVPVERIRKLGWPDLARALLAE